MDKRCIIIAQQMTTKMRQSLIKTATIVTGMGGELGVNFLGNDTAKVTIKLPHTETLELMSGASIKKIEKTASLLLDKAKSFKSNSALTDEEILQSATSNA